MLIAPLSLELEQRCRPFWNAPVKAYNILQGEAGQMAGTVFLSVFLTFKCNNIVINIVVRFFF